MDNWLLYIVMNTCANIHPCGICDGNSNHHCDSTYNAHCDSIDNHHCSSFDSKMPIVTVPKLTIAEL